MFHVLSFIQLTLAELSVVPFPKKKVIKACSLKSVKGDSHDLYLICATAEDSCFSAEFGIF